MSGTVGKGKRVCFLWLTWEADWRMSLGVVRVMGVPGGCSPLPAEAQDSRRDQARYAQYQKNQGDREPGRLHAQDRRCLGVCDKEQTVDGAKKLVGRGHPPRLSESRRSFFRGLRCITSCSSLVLPKNLTSVAQWGTVMKFVSKSRNFW